MTAPDRPSTGPRALIDTCVHCGFCLSACPTYRLWGQEADSPRGRIFLLKLADDGEAAITPRWAHHFDTCLGCMACMTACPSGVDYEQLLEFARGAVARGVRRSWRERVVRRVIFSLFPRPDRLRALRPLLVLYARGGIRAAAKRMRILEMLPGTVRALDALLPPLTRPVPTPEVTPAKGERRGRVGLLLGCVQREYLSEVNAATIRVLAAEGCEVVAPARQPCCGALLLHAGEEERGRAMARAMIDAFEGLQVDAVVSNAAGCGSAVKAYARLLEDDPRYAERAQRFAAACRDVTELLVELGPRAPRHPIAARVAYHDACHLQHAQRVRDQPRALLGGIPDLDLVEVPDPAICCGSAGVYNLLQPMAARLLGDRKARDVLSVRPDAVATGNSGCIFQLRAALDRVRADPPVLHSIQILDASIRGGRLEKRRNATGGLPRGEASQETSPRTY
ncbi:MAG TPA: heterodisulfide reductase-related iron-sulfur binding cluster [Chloroflexota bacterium]|nr:heterodisulfide reductase-related iron-sulfur binding cluster [Chloroflexota bacterium]